MQVPGFMYTFDDSDISFLLKRFEELLSSGGYLTMGPYCDEFETAIAAYLDVNYAISVSSGTSALEIILRCLDVRGKDVIVPTNTFAATVYAILAAGGRPIFTDIGDDLIVDPASVEEHITPMTAAVITVHIGGIISATTPALKKICDDRSIPLIEDAAHAHGSKLMGKSPGSFGIAAAFSFFSTKVMTTGEGGMIVTNDRDIADQARLLRDQGKVGGRNYHLGFGYNWRLTEFQAIMGLTQLNRLEEFILERSRVSDIYRKGLEETSGIQLVVGSPDLRQNYYKFILLLDGSVSPEDLQSQLKEEFSIGASGFVYEVPCHLQPAFAEYATEELTRAEDLCKRHFCLPIYPRLTSDQAMYIVDALKSCLRPHVNVG